jgi:hypothetical protein
MAFLEVAGVKEGAELRTELGQRRRLNGATAR